MLERQQKTAHEGCTSLASRTVCDRRWATGGAPSQ